MKRAYAPEIMTCYCLRYLPKSAAEKDHLQKERKRERDTRSTAKENTNHAHANKTKPNQTKPNWTKWNQNKYMLNGEQIAENLTIYCVQGPVGSIVSQSHGLCNRKAILMRIWWSSLNGTARPMLKRSFYSCRFNFVLFISSNRTLHGNFMIFYGVI